MTYDVYLSRPDRSSRFVCSVGPQSLHRIASDATVVRYLAAGIEVTRKAKVYFFKYCD